jgi:hypothetical protein
MKYFALTVWCRFQVMLCECGHSSADHKPEIGIRLTYKDMAEKALYDVNCGWLYANKTEEEVRVCAAPLAV